LKQADDDRMRGTQTQNQPISPKLGRRPCMIRGGVNLSMPLGLSGLRMRQMADCRVDVVTDLGAHSDGGVP